MQTPFGDLRVCDAHVHFFSHAFFSTLGGQKGLSLQAIQAFVGWQLPGAEPVELAERWSTELDTHGVSRCVLIASMPGDDGSVAAAVRAFPGKFIGYFMCDPTAAGAADQAGRAFDAGLKGMCLFP
ncbi:MAG TPA: amidohydrolase, partial [Bryobacteraceae bacterium]|nr:amidohydrolase [Bryobacteraceae bacterium]